MKPVFHLPSGLYAFFSTRRWILYLCTLSLAASGAFFSRQVEISENVASLLPDDRSETAETFSLLSRMPFSRKVVITLQGSPETETGLLLSASQELARNLGPPYFTRVVSGHEFPVEPDFFIWILEALPNLFTAADLKKVDADLSTERIRSRLETVRQRLLAPSGIAEKPILRSDPLGLVAYGFEKFAAANPIPGAQVSRRGFLSPDGKSSLILADTPIEVTDFREGKRLIEHLERLIAVHAPPGIVVDYISPHRYTVANAEIMKADIWRVIGVSSALLAALLLVFLPQWRAAFVFLVPVFSLLVASGTLFFFFDAVSAVTLGFGAVLLGITVDFALHVYFAVSQENQPAGPGLDEVSRPVFFSALTTMCAFGVLFYSKLPGQRQLAAFAIAGILHALLVSLMVLPHLIEPTRRTPSLFQGWVRAPGPAVGKSIVWVWALILILSGFGMRHLRFNGDLAALNRVPPAVLKAEAETQRTWGSFRSTALILAQGSTLEAALALNEQVLTLIQRDYPFLKPVTIAPLLPSAAAQQDNRNRWKAFWNSGNGARHLAFLKAEAASRGFAPEAFQPFFDRLARDAKPLDLETLFEKGLAPIIETLLIRTGNGFSVATLAQDTPETAASLARIPETLPGVRLVSQSRFKEVLGSAITRDFIDFLIRAAAAVLLLAAFLFRRIKRLLLAAVPVVTGTVVMLAGTAWLQMEFNLFNIVATILVIGLSIDYGIIMVCRLSFGSGRHTERAVLVSGLTTLSGFAALTAARHPALSSIGLTVVLGIGAAVPSALWVVPTLHRKFLKEKENASL